MGRSFLVEERPWLLRRCPEVSESGAWQRSAEGRSNATAMTHHATERRPTSPIVWTAASATGSCGLQPHMTGLGERFGHSWPFCQLSQKAAARTNIVAATAKLICLRMPPSSKAYQKSGSFPPPALPGFNGHTTLSNSRRCRRPKRTLRPLPSHQTGLPRLPEPPFQRAVPTTPADRAGAYVDCFPASRGLPQIAGGSASALSLSRPLQASLTLRPAGSLSHPQATFVTRLQPARLPE